MTHSASAPSQDIKPWYAQLWPWLLMLGPFLVVVAGSYMIWIAFTQQDALVVGDYYKEGQAINQDLRRDRTAAALGLTLDLRYDAASGMLMGTLKSNAKPYGEKLRIQLNHSTLPEKDLHFIAQAGADGRFAVALPMLEITRWQVLVEDEHRDWRLEGSWAWPRQQQIRIDSDAVSKD